VFDEPEVFSLSRWFVDDDMDALVPREDLEHVGYGFGRRVCAGKVRSIMMSNSSFISPCRRFVVCTEL
jgi:cytochrome P450